MSFDARAILGGLGLLLGGAVGGDDLVEVQELLGDLVLSVV